MHWDWVHQFLHLVCDIKTNTFSVGMMKQSKIKISLGCRVQSLDKLVVPFNQSLSGWWFKSDDSKNQQLGNWLYSHTDSKSCAADCTRNWLNPNGNGVRMSIELATDETYTEFVCRSHCINSLSLSLRHSLAVFSLWTGIFSWNIPLNSRHPFRFGSFDCQIMRNLPHQSSF